MNKWISRLAHDYLARSLPVKRATYRAHNWKMKSHARLYVFVSVLQVRLTREELTKFSVWQKVMFCVTMFLPTLYIPSLPTNCKECFSERKSYKIHLRVRDCHIHNYLYISLWFSSTLISPSLHS